jgi:deazaflavin-dependent oxidoreductase (nitroreductase family)
MINLFGLDRLRLIFKRFNVFMLFLWRLGLGRWMDAWPKVGGRIMVLVHTGRKTGVQRRTPVNFTMLGEDIIIVAGFGEAADWYRNIKHHPEVEVWLPGGWWKGVAEDDHDPENALSTMRQLMVDTGFAAPLMGVNPNKLSDAELAKIAADYKLVRIRRTAARTGPGGPGDLAWFWPVATLVLAGVLWLRRKK